VDRKELGKLIKTIAAGDQVVVTRIDRLARSTFELFAIVKKSSARAGNFSALPNRGRTHRPAPAGS
jgi:DNA invertase Pin-like site-specific DNA recombinase